MKNWLRAAGLIASVLVSLSASGQGPSYPPWTKVNNTFCYLGQGCTVSSSGFVAAGDLSGNATSQEVVGILSEPLPSLTTGYLNWTGSAWALSAGGSMTWPSAAGYALYSGSNSWSTSHLTDNGSVVTSSEPLTASGIVSNGSSISAAANISALFNASGYGVLASYGSNATTLGSIGLRICHSDGTGCVDDVGVTNTGDLYAFGPDGFLTNTIKDSSYNAKLSWTAGAGSTINVSGPLSVSGPPGVVFPAGTAAAGAAGSVVYAVDSTNGYAEVNENNGGLSRICTAANGICVTSIPAQYKTWSCQTGLGDGYNAIPAQTYLQTFCYNTSGVTQTITGILCYADGGTPTLNATNGAGTGLLTGAITCSSSFAAGTQSGTTTIAAGDYIKFTFVAGGTAKQTTWVVKGTY
jgi:hypothetical protein